MDYDAVVFWRIGDAGEAADHVRVGKLHEADPKRSPVAVLSPRKVTLPFGVLVCNVLCANDGTLDSVNLDAMTWKPILKGRIWGGRRGGEGAGG